MVLIKWYSVNLRDDEIALTLRSQVLSICLSQAHDQTSNPVLDSLEVYALERDAAVETWLPTTLSPQSVSVSSVDASHTRSAVTMACSSLESIYCILRPVKSPNTAENEFLKGMVEATLHDRVLQNSIDILLKQLYPSPQARNSIKDEGALQGCSRLLARTQDLMAKAMSGCFDSAWFTIRKLVGSVLLISKQIAICRPINYLKASDVLAENKTSSGSIAVDASQIIHEIFQRSLPCANLCETFVELALAESAIGDRKNQGANLASFASVIHLLESSNLEVVHRSCQVISSFCRNDGAASNRSKEFFSCLDAARLVCYQVRGALRLSYLSKANFSTFAHFGSENTVHHSATPVPQFL